MKKESGSFILTDKMVTEPERRDFYKKPGELGMSSEQFNCWMFWVHLVNYLKKHFVQEFSENNKDSIFEMTWTEDEQFFHLIIKSEKIATNLGLPKVLRFKKYLFETIYGELIIRTGVAAFYPIPPSSVFKLSYSCLLELSSNGEIVERVTPLQC